MRKAKPRLEEVSPPHISKFPCHCAFDRATIHSDYTLTIFLIVVLENVTENKGFPFDFFNSELYL